MTRVPMIVLVAALPLSGIQVLGCNGDEGTDAGEEEQRDAGGGSDAATGTDTATGVDTSTGTDSATASDTLLPDSALPDTLVPDSALPDTLVPDSALPDTLLPDAAPATDPPPGTWTTQAVNPYSALYAESAVSKPRVAMNASGDALLTWGQNSHPMLAERIGGVWSFPSDVNHHLPVEAQVSDIWPALADNGDAAVSWSANVGGSKIMHSIKTGGGWAHPAQLSDRYDYAGGVGTRPQLAMSGDGSGLLIWDYYYNGMVAATASGGSWAQPGDPVANYLISVDGTFSSGSAGNSGVGVGNGGNMVAAWIHNDGAGLVVHMAHRIGTWSMGTLISPTPGVTSGYMEAPKVAVGNNGDALVTWAQWTAWDACTNCGALYLSEYTGGAWTHPADSTDIFSLTDDTIRGFSDGGFVGIADNGDAVVVWRQYELDNSTAQIYVAERTGGVWNIPGPDEYIPLPGDAHGTATFDATMGRNGDVLIVRLGYNATRTRSGLFIIQRINGHWHIPVSPAELLMMGNGSGNDPVVAVGANGQAIIAAVCPDDVSPAQRLFIAEYTPD